MELLFLGGLFDKKQEKEIINKSNGTIQYAANKFQWNLIDGFKRNENVKLRTLSAPFIGNYPKEYKDKFIKSTYQYDKNSKIGYSIGFNNFPVLKNISRTRGLSKEIKQFARLSTNEKKYIMVYSVHTPLVIASVKAKKYDPSIHICLVVPDLPEFMDLRDDKSKLYTYLKKIDIKIFEKTLKYIDSFVILTEPMKNRLSIGNRPYMVVEGIVSSEYLNKVSKSKLDHNNENVKTIVYTGSLHKKFGVMELIEAFKKIEQSNVKLILCGSGDSEEEIKKISLENRKIIYLGQLSNDEVLELQKTASVLVNPRPNNEEYTKYSFPSKNMEYLLSGIPMVARKLDGVPSDYDDYIFYTKDESVQSLSKKIDQVLKLSKKKRIIHGEKSRDFVLKNKNSTIITNNIYNMMTK